MSEESGTSVAPPSSALVRLARALVDAEKRVEEQESLLKKAKLVKDIAERKLAEHMKTVEVRAFRTDFGGFRTQVEVYPNVLDKDALAAWVKKKKLTWLYSTNIHGGKFRAFVKELMEKGKSVPPGVDPYMATVIRKFK